MLVFVLVAVPISFLNTLNLVAGELLVSGADFLNVFTVDQRDSLALLFLNLYE